MARPLQHISEKLHLIVSAWPNFLSPAFRFLSFNSYRFIFGTGKRTQTPGIMRVTFAKLFPGPNILVPHPSYFLFLFALVLYIENKIELEIHKTITSKDIHIGR